MPATIISPSLRRNRHAEHTQEPARSHQTTPIRHQTLTHHHQAKTEHTQRHCENRSVCIQPTHRKAHTPNMGLHLLEQDIGRDLEDNIWNKENRQSDIILHSLFDVQIFLEAEEHGIADVDSARWLLREHIYIYIYIWGKYRCGGPPTDQ